METCAILLNSIPFDSYWKLAWTMRLGEWLEGAIEEKAARGERERQPK